MHQYILVIWGDNDVVRLMRFDDDAAATDESVRVAQLCRANLYAIDHQVIGLHEKQEALRKEKEQQQREWEERRDREEYVRLKARFEGGEDDGKQH